MSRHYADGPVYEMACVFKARTDHAVLIYDPASKTEVWIPLSQVYEMSEGKGGEGTICMSEWIAKKKGLV